MTFYQIGLKLSQRLLKHSLSFSADGEDVICWKLLSGLKHGFYLDFGAHHPVKMSNTFSLYCRGWQGIAVDPLPGLQRLYEQTRPRDWFVPRGIGDDGKDLDFFYYQDYPDNSTFDTDRATELERLHGRKPSDIKKVHCSSVASIISEYMQISGVNRELPEVHFASIDVEGQEESILSELLSINIKPWVICVEELGFTPETLNESGVYRLLNHHHYMLIARTYLSSIYIDENRLHDFPSPYLKELNCLKINNENSNR